jgi:predicted metal-dependent phosphoesterase TrpH
MDLVTITDHDSIDGCLELLDPLGERPDFIMGEEVSATTTCQSPTWWRFSANVGTGWG